MFPMLVLCYSRSYASVYDIKDNAHIVYLKSLDHIQSHGDPTDMRESTSVFQIRTINWSKLDK